MKGYKTDDSRLIGIFKDSRDAWKTKCVFKQKRIKALEIKLRDTASSRGQWKQKTKFFQTQLASSEALLQEKESLLQQKEALLQAKQAEIELLKKKLNQSNIQLEMNPK